MFFIVLAVATLGGAAAHLALGSELPVPEERVVEILLLYVLVVFVGIGLFIGGIWHIFFGRQAALMVGWPAGNPFQRELGWACLALGAISLLSARFRGTYWVGPSVAYSVFLLGSAAGHIVEARRMQSALSSHARAVLIVDLIMPIVVLGLLLLHQRR